ncbi:Gfo/Idh/MocA family protein [Leptolyngbya iicbica]|uniref:Gfo/Idh/MocA family oxidoreductase n=2 Tax=Cyanophyceae TaxID=3028117 RepID=A0A4V2E2L0_9CYAN|nr:Gfo/Idh/MocA family oxidoreductase [Leptolyngbya sp. LK]RZM78926.1 gfo/Idh/MocA family oxidoreductase [Leptolyngbya sp. LK]
MVEQNLVRWGILGTGWIAGQFAKDLRRVPGATLVGVASRSQQKAEQFAQSFPGCRAYASYQDLVQAPDIDVVYVATPHIRHSEDCLLALHAGKSVLCEKPFTINRPQAEEIFAIAKANNLFCMEAMWMRFIPLMQEARRMVQQGELGKIRFITADFGYPVGFSAENRLFNLELGGGSLLDRGCYALSLAVYLLGQPEQITGLAHIGPTGVDEQCSMTLRYANGALAQLAATVQTHSTNQAVIAGTRGQLVIKPPFFYPECLVVHRFPDRETMAATPPVSLPTDFKGRLKSTLKANVWYKRLRRWRPTGGKTLTQLDGGNGYQYQAMEVGRCLQAGLLESSLMPWADTLQVLDLMDTLRASWQLSYAQDQSLTVSE